MLHDTVCNHWWEGTSEMLHYVDGHFDWFPPTIARKLHGLLWLLIAREAVATYPTPRMTVFHVQISF